MCVSRDSEVQGVDQEQSVSLAPRGEFPRVARRLVLCSRPRGPTQAAVPSTVEDAASTVTERHVFFGSPVESDTEATDGTASVGVVSDGVVSTQMEVDEFTFRDDIESAGESVEPVVQEDPVRVEDNAPSRVMREAMISLDTVDVMALVLWCCMKYPPGFLRSAFKSVRFAPQEASMATKARDDRLCRAWKLFMLAPRMLLFRRSRGGLIPKNTLLERFAQFGREKWGHTLDSKQRRS